MPARDLSRWQQNDDGTWRLKSPGDVAKIPARYDEMTKPELEAELELRGLAKTGNKPELIARLQEDDAV